MDTYTIQEDSSVRSYNLKIGLSIVFGLLLTVWTAYGFQNSVGAMFSFHPIIFSLVYLFVAVIVFHRVIQSVTSTGTLFGYAILCFVTGLLLSSFLPYFDANAVFQAFLTTFGILAVMILISTIYPDLFRNMGGTLFLCLGSFILVELAVLIFFGSEPDFMNWICIGIFTLYIGFDWSKGMAYPKTTKYAVITALELYLDIINIFIRLLSSSSGSNSNKR